MCVFVLFFGGPGCSSRFVRKSSKNDLTRTPPGTYNQAKTLYCCSKSKLPENIQILVPGVSMPVWHWILKGFWLTFASLWASKGGPGVQLGATGARMSRPTNPKWSRKAKAERPGWSNLADRCGLGMGCNNSVEFELSDRGGVGWYPVKS